MYFFPLRSMTMHLKLNLPKDSRPCLAFLSALITGGLTHFFALVTVFHNYDSITQLPSGYGTGITSGRWFLDIVGKVCMKLGFGHNVPAMNGLVFLILLAVTAGFLVSVLGIRTRAFAILAGAFTAAFPAAVSTLFFSYTAPYYGLAILLSVLAVWVLGRVRFSFLLSAMMTALALGIYQAYTPLTIGIFLVLLIRQALEEKAEWLVLIRRGLLYCGSLVLGLALYFGILKALLAITGNTMNNYQGLDQMGQLSLASIPGLILRAFTEFLTFPIRNYCGLASSVLLKGGYAAIAVLTAVLAVCALISLKKQPLSALLTGLFLALFPLAVNFIVIMCPTSKIYTLMIYGFLLVPFLPMVLWECLAGNACAILPSKPIIRSVLCVATAAITALYIYEANVNYTALYYTNRQTENYVNSLVAQVRMTEGFSSQLEWAFLGEIQDPLLEDPWEDVALFGGNTDPLELLNSYSRKYWFRNYIGYDIPLSDGETVRQLSQLDAVRAMPCWPDYGSVKVIEDTVVIKFQDIVP